MIDRYLIGAEACSRIHPSGNVIVGDGDVATGVCGVADELGLDGDVGGGRVTERSLRAWSTDEFVAAVETSWVRAGKNTSFESLR